MGLTRFDLAMMMKLSINGFSGDSFFWPETMVLQFYKIDRKIYRMSGGLYMFPSSNPTMLKT